MGDASLVLVGADGAIFGAPLGTTMPEAVDDVLDDAFTDLGFISDDGLTETIGTSSNKIKNWRGDSVRVVQTEHSLTYEFTMIETSPETAEVYYGTDPAEGIEGIQGLRQAWVFDVFDGDNILRVPVADGQVIDRPQPVTYKNSEAAAYRVRVEAYPDDANKKAFHFKSVDGS